MLKDVIIEFIGLPGAGKSLIKSMLKDSLKNHGFYLVERRQLENGINQLFFIQTIFRYWIVIKNIISTIIFLFQFKPLGLFSPHIYRPAFWLIRDIRIFCNLNTSRYTLLTSEGVAQHIVNFCVWSHIDPIKLVSIIPKDLSRIQIIYLRMNREFAFERVINRGVPDSWPKYAVLNIKDTLEVFEKNISELRQILIQRGAKFQELDGSEEPSKILSSIII